MLILHLHQETMAAASKTDVKKTTKFLIDPFLEIQMLEKNLKIKKVQAVIFFIVLIYYIFVILKTFKNNKNIIN